MMSKGHDGHDGHKRHNGTPYFKGTHTIILEAIKTPPIGALRHTQFIKTRPLQCHHGQWPLCPLHMQQLWKGGLSEN